MMTLSPERFRKIASAGAKSLVENCSALFMENPTTERFAELQAAMYLFQFTKSDAQKVYDVLASHPMGEYANIVMNRIEKNL